MDNRSSKAQSQHRRQPALGKSMPVTALLLNLDVTWRSHDERGVPLLEDDEDEPPRYFAAPVELQEPPSPGDSGSPDPTHYAEDQLLGNTRNDTPCLNCSQNGSDPRSGAGGIINEMCQLLCNEECRQQGLSLCGHQIRAQDGQQQQEQLHAAFLKQYEIAEALAKTSAMTSTSKMKQRLAARKLEMEIETQTAAAAAGHEAARLATPRLEIDIDDAGGGAAACSTTVNAAAAGDTVPPSVDHEMPPPRDLLLYLVR